MTDGFCSARFLRSVVLSLGGLMMNDNEKEAPKLRPMLSMKQVLKIVPVSRSTLGRMMDAGRFPKSHWLSDGRVAWFEDEVIAWQAQLT
jgi:prophage regulatory protein